MIEMASLGARVLQIRAVRFAMRYRVPLHVRSSFNRSQGTWVVVQEEIMERLVVSGVTYNRNEAKIRISGVKDLPGVVVQIFKPISDAGIIVDMIVQNLSHDGTTDVTFTVPKDDYQKAIALARAAGKEVGSPGVEGDEDIAKGIDRRPRHEGSRRRRNAHVPGVRRRGHQHPDDLYQRNQDFRGDRGEVHRVGGARPSRGLRGKRCRGAHRSDVKGRPTAARSGSRAGQTGQNPHASARVARAGLLAAAVLLALAFPGARRAPGALSPSRGNPGSRGAERRGGVPGPARVCR